MGRFCKYELSFSFESVYFPLFNILNKRVGRVKICLFTRCFWKIQECCMAIEIVLEVIIILLAVMRYFLFTS